MNEKYKYGNLCDKYDMSGDIHIGTGIVRVHDIFNPLPLFMRGADIVFSDPPYNKSALTGYYTKAEKKGEGPDSFEAFFFRFFECIDIIGPRLVCLEVGIPQTTMYLNMLHGIYSNVIVKSSCYYGNTKNKCNILIASNEPIPDVLCDMPFMDEEKVIEYICRNVDFNCIADPCMGKGLVAFYANKYGKKFVGTELNKYRLAVCCERVTTGERGKIN